MSADYFFSSLSEEAGFLAGVDGLGAGPRGELGAGELELGGAGLLG